MRLPLFTAAILAITLAGCDHSSRQAAGDGSAHVLVNTADDGAISITAGDDAQAPTIDAKLRLPGLKLTPSNMDLNGIKLFPGTQITGMSIVGKNEDGRVTMAYDAAAAPADLLAYYRHEAIRAGYVLQGGADEVIATRRSSDGKDEMVDVTARAAAAGGGSAGSIAVSGT